METHCHIKKGPLCVFRNFTAMPVDFYSAYTTYEALVRSVLYEDNDICVKNTININYWIAYEKSLQEDEHLGLSQIYSILSISIIITGVGLSFLLYRSIKRRKEERLIDESPTNRSSLSIRKRSTKNPIKDRSPRRDETPENGRSPTYFESPTNKP